MHFIVDALSAAWQMLLDASVFIILGVVAGGLVHSFLRPETVARHLGGRGLWPVLKAAVLGVPLPLCSCGVLGAAAAIQKQGAGTGATTSFLIATPESGVDSIAATYALMDPVMTLARPVAAVTSAVAAGLAQDLGRKEVPATAQPLEPGGLAPAQCGGGAGCACSCSSTPAAADDPRPGRPGLWRRIGDGQRYALDEVWGDISLWFWAGILIAGAITAWLPAEILSGDLGGGLPAMLGLMVVGIPLYICSTASTPIAAALILKGVAPGAVLVFLLVGPATNLATLAVVRGMLGTRATVIYLVAIALTALGCGLALDAVYAGLGLAPAAVAGAAAEIIPPWAQWAGALTLVGLTLPILARRLGWGAAERPGCSCPAE